jgi:hypothetical protein
MLPMRSILLLPITITHYCRHTVTVQKQLQMQASTTNLFAAAAASSASPPSIGTAGHRPRSRSQKKRGFLMVYDGTAWHKQLSVLRNGVLYCYERKGQMPDDTASSSTSTEDSRRSLARKFMRSESEIFEEKCYVVRECVAIEEVPVPADSRLFYFTILTGIGDINAGMNQ